MTDTPLLDKTQKKAIDRELLRMHRILAKCDTVEACGVDCAEFRATAQYLAEQFKLLLEKACPNDQTTGG